MAPAAKTGAMVLRSTHARLCAANADRPEMDSSVRSFTDPESRNMRPKDGFAQACDSQTGVDVSSSVSSRAKPAAIAGAADGPCARAAVPAIAASWMHAGTP